MLPNSRSEGNTDSEFDAAQLYDWAVNSPTRFADYPDEEKLVATREAWRRHMDSGATDADALDVLRLAWATLHCRAWLQECQRKLFWSRDEKDTFAALMAPELHWRARGDDLDTSVDPADIVSRAVTWQTWPGVLAVGEVTILVGLPNMGKSTLARLIAARAAQGKTMPNMLKQDDSPELAEGAAKVLWVSMEENPSYTIKPGLEVAGVPPDGWRYVNARRAGEGGKRLTLDDDGLKRLGYMADKHEARLVVLDGTDAFVPDGMSPNRGEHVSEILNALGDWAAESSLSVLLFRHEGKASRGRGVESGTGSIQWQGGVRLSFILEHQDKGDTNSPINLAATKDNLSPTRSVEVRIEPRMTLVQGKGLVNKSFGYAVLGELNDIGADKMVTSTADTKGGEVDDAGAWLAATLAAGPMAAKDVLAAGQDTGFKERTLRRAKSELRIKSKIVDGAWQWLPPDNTASSLGSLGSLGNVDGPPVEPTLPTLPTLPSKREGADMSKEWEKEPGAAEFKFGIWQMMEDAAKRAGIEPGSEEFLRRRDAVQKGLEKVVAVRMTGQVTVTGDAAIG